MFLASLRMLLLTPDPPIWAISRPLNVPAVFAQHFLLLGDFVLISLRFCSISS